MINIRSVSDLRNYTDALKDIGPDSPVFLTKNGRGKYVVMLIEDYEKLISARRIDTALCAERRSSRIRSSRSHTGCERSARGGACRK